MSEDVRAALFARFTPQRANWLMQEELARRAELVGAKPDDMQGPEWEDWFWHFRMSGTEVNGNETPDIHMYEAIQYACDHKLRPAVVLLELQSGHKLTERADVYVQSGGKRKLRRRRHQKNHDRKELEAIYDRMNDPAGDLAHIAGVLTPTAERLSRRTSTGGKWVDLMEAKRLRFAQAHDLHQAPQYMADPGVRANLMRLFAEGDAYASAAIDKVSTRFDAKARRGEATYAVGNYYGHINRESDDIDPEPVRINEKGFVYILGGRAHPEEAAFLTAAADRALEIGMPNTMVREVNEAGHRTRPTRRNPEGSLWTFRTLCENNLASPRMFGWQVRGQWDDRYHVDSETEMAHPYTDERLVECRFIEPLMSKEKGLALMALMFEGRDGRRTYTRYPLSGLGKCWCGASLNGRARPGRPDAPDVMCGRRRDGGFDCDCGKPDGRCACRAKRTREGTRHPVMSMPLLKRVLLEAAMASYGAQRVAALANADLADVVSVEARKTALRAMDVGFRERRRDTWDGYTARAYTVEERDEKMAAIDRDERARDAEVEALETHQDRIAQTADPEAMRRKAEEDDSYLVSLCRGVMDGYSLVPGPGGPHDERRVTVNWKEGHEPPAGAMEALYAELRESRETAAVLSRYDANPSMSPGDAGLMMRLYDQGKTPLDIVKALRPLGIKLADSVAPEGSPQRQKADIGFLTVAIKRECLRQDREYVTRRNRGSKYPQETRTIVYELCKRGDRTYPEFAAQLNVPGNPAPPLGNPEWTAQLVANVYRAECSVLSETPVGRKAQLSRETIDLLRAKKAAGQTHAELAGFLNRAKIRRHCGKPWDSKAVFNAMCACGTGGLHTTDEQRIEMMRMIDGGERSRAVAAWANANNVPRRSGKPWTVASISDLRRRRDRARGEAKRPTTRTSATHKREIIRRYAAGATAEELVAWATAVGATRCSGKPWDVFAIRYIIKNAPASSSPTVRRLRSGRNRVPGGSL